MMTHRRLVARGRTGLAAVLGALAALAAVGVANDARAQQIDVNPPMPNVMVLVDTSGSMEKMPDGTDPESNAANKCNGDASTNQSSSPNRWGIALQALTGDISPSYACISVPRTKGTAFDKEYSINGFSPYDVDYYLPYHRPVAINTISNVATPCVYAPGPLPGLATSLNSGVGSLGATQSGAGGNAYDFNANSIQLKTWPAGAPTTSVVGACTFPQLQNGLIDAGRDIARFGMMTFDTDTNAGTGVISSTDTVLTASSPFTGSWSYFSGWQSSTASAATGRPSGCATSSVFEVGARNFDAPPWEGRLIGVPTDPDASLATVESNNDNIQLAINAMRPYGATPIAGMLNDARYYFWSDTKGPQQTDKYVQGKCRKEYIILLTDGAPNLDLRTPNPPGCTTGQCPYSNSDTIAGDLYAGTSGQVVKTYVVGFAVSSAADGTTPADCEALVDAGTLTTTCASTDATTKNKYSACCTLNAIATAGGTTHAYFVRTSQDLQTALSKILADIASSTTTRTVPAYSPSVTSGDPTAASGNASVYLASVTPEPSTTWIGDVQRQRYVCDSQQNLTAPAPDASKGDDFEQNLASGTGSTYPDRQFLIVRPNDGASSTSGDATATMRPYETADNDGLGTYSGVAYGLDVASNVTAKFDDPKAMQITSTTCANQFNTKYLSASACKDLVFNFVMGSTSSSGSQPDSTFKAFVSRSSYPLGDIYHSTPTVVAPPSALLRDASYTAFGAETIASGQREVKGRPTVLYTASNDGILHAFDVNVATRENNEIWGFLPPAPYPNLKKLYSAGHVVTLDGAPVVKDAVWERKSSQLSSSTPWHTTLVAGFGAGGRGYYALDVTSPDRPPRGAGPQFRWQLTNMPTESDGSVKQIFGAHGATPAIGTVFVDPKDPNDPGARELGVAILPGGEETGPTTTGNGCTRAAATDDTNNKSVPKGAYAANTTVHCWPTTSGVVPGRSVTVVRLDTGEIIKVFARAAETPTAIKTKSKNIDVNFDSPVTGTPVVYPAVVGAVTSEFFVGDADGAVWRFDVSDTNPDNWKAEIYFDTMNDVFISKAGLSSATAWKSRNPISVPPVVTVDSFGSVVLHVATGDTDTYTASGTNFLVALSEKLSSEATPLLRASVDWYQVFTSGERVSGPMAVFDSVLYFATFQAASDAAVCTGGTPRLWGRDFIQPQDTTDLSKGGVPRFNPGPPANPSGPTSPAPDSVSPAQFAGKVIPGVSINMTPTCSDISQSITDPYTGGTHYVTQSLHSSKPQLYVAGGGSDQTGTTTLGVDIPPPGVPTLVDSWASVVE